MITIAALVIAIVFWPVTLIVLAIIYWPVTLTIAVLSACFYVIYTVVSSVVSAAKTLFGVK
jgi:hypothetical protein